MDPATPPSSAVLPLRQHDAQDLKISSLITQVPRTSSSFPFSPTNWFRAFCSCFRGQSVETEMECKSRDDPLLPPLKKKGKKTLVLDLDETLVHSGFKQEPQTKVIVPVNLDGKVVLVYVNVRPGVQAFLDRAAELFEVVVFTASLAKYADPLLDKIDTFSRVSSRLFRESCLLQNGTYVKDLSRLGRDLKDVLIVDVCAMQNSPASYGLHPNNAIPITSWFDDPEDKELFNLLPVLEMLAQVEDVTHSIEETRKQMRAPLTPLLPPPPLPPIRAPEPFLDTPTSQDSLENRTCKRRYRRRSLGQERAEFNSPAHATTDTKFDFDKQT